MHASNGTKKPLEMLKIGMRVKYFNFPKKIRKVLNEAGVNFTKFLEFWNFLDIFHPYKKNEINLSTLYEVNSTCVLDKGNQQFHLVTSFAVFINKISK